MKRIDLIQILRFLGACCVILYHSGIAGEFGYFGVELFSFVSGYIMIYTTQSAQSDKGFLLKRGIRLIPLYWALTILYYGIICIRPSLSIMSEPKPEYLIKSMLFIPFQNSYGYDTPILGAGWTLNYEVMFYLIFFLAMKVCHKHRAMITVGITAALTVVNWILPGEHFYIGYYANSFLLEFSMGILDFYLIEKVQEYRNQKRVRVFCTMTAFVLALWMIFFGGRISGIPRFLYPGIPMFALFCTLILGWGKKQFPKVLVELGNMSYSIYLIEYFTMAFFKVVAGNFNVGLKWAVFLVILSVTLGCSWISYVVVEQKLTGFLRHKSMQLN